ncbi:vWA domain-containing protein [Streptomyces iconiensis]|uniref:von Willebrand factor type A domain-containing protein n=1 Tax=Streptomyces iconiensis TaxID=1384038 RepID=A0ABT6ZYB1_9ACTN|nr:von Willebrand factor type A domain-containing protein [Streptomyces iconiensis]MDJ1133393.1 von Willebrand factor type A domain-containing protein [Streptomyces iconiensis]
MRRGWSRWAVGAVAVGLLAGCSGGAEKNTSLADDGGGPAARAPGAGGGAPGYVKGGEEGGGADREPSAPADFRSTFALDVDTASYSYAKRTVRGGALPEPGTVRTEEFVNSFPQGYKRPTGDGFSVTADGARTGDGWSLMRVGLATGQENMDAPRKPAALTFVLDVSGSMAEPGRLDLVKDALRMAARELGPKDSVSLVTFSGEAETVLPMTRLDDGGRQRLRGAVAELEPQDSTNLGAGVREGYAQAAGHRRAGATNRVVLLSDALANTGDTDANEILRGVESHRKEHGITLFGVGVGSDYGDALMERLANRGDGHTAYISGKKEAREVFVERLPRNIGLRARDAKAQVAFDPETVERFRLLGYENRAVANEDFRDDRVDGGEIGPGHTVTALYAVRLKEAARDTDGRAATATVRWLDPGNRKPREKARTVDAAELTGGEIWSKPGGSSEGGGKGEEISPRLRLAAVAAYFADYLRAREPGGPAEHTETQESPHAPEPPEGDVAGASPLPGAPPPGALRAHAARVADETGDRSAAELSRVIGKAMRLK